MRVLEEKYIHDLIDHLIQEGFIEERSIIIEGQHPDLELYKEWYSGFVPSFHKYRGRVNGEPAWKTKQHSQLCKMICESIASNFANEKTSITIPNKAQQSAMDKLMLKFFKNWSQFVEKYQALGIGATVVMPSKIIYDNETRLIERSEESQVKIYTIDATRIIPITVDEEGVKEVLFVRDSTKSVTLQIHLQKENGDYIVAEIDGMKKSKESTDLIFDYTKTAVLEIGSTPLFQIWYPNITDNVHLDKKIGISRFANSIEWVKTVDEILSSFFTEFKNGKKKRFVSVDLEHVDASGVRTLELDDEDIALPQGRDKNNLLQEFNSELRAQAHVLGMNFALAGASKSAGLGTSDFVFDPSTGGRPIQTATGAVIKETEKYRTIMKEEALAEENLKNMLLAIKYVNNTFVQSKVNYTFDFDKINIIFDDNIVEDTDAKKKLAIQEIQVGARYPYEYRVEFFNEDKETAKKLWQEEGGAMNYYANAVANGLDTAKNLVIKMHGDNYDGAAELEEQLKNNFAPQVEPMDYMVDESSMNQNKENEEGGEEENE